MFYEQLDKYHMDITHMFFIDKQYLLYSCITRIYSCYDKIAKYLAEKTDRYSKVRYFSDFKEYVYKYNDIISKKISEILNCENYLLMENLRNNIYHNLRPGALYGDEGMNYFNTVLTQVVFESTKIIFDLLNFLIPDKNVKQLPNELCYCGSLIKYKKCCKLKTKL